jgi:hypothetical protein
MTYMMSTMTYKKKRTIPYEGEESIKRIRAARRALRREHKETTGAVNATG